MHVVYGVINVMIAWTNYIYKMSSEYVELVESSNKHQRTDRFLTYSTLYDEKLLNNATVVERAGTFMY